MPIISIAIQKGGAGKTTTCINLGTALANTGKKVLLVDADPQANLSQSLGVPPEPAQNLYTELKKEMSGEGSQIREAIINVKEGLDIVPSSIELAGAELELVSVYGREQVFSWLLQPVSTDYDFILIDCPHAVGMLTVNALVCSDYVFIPLPAEFLPLKGVYSFMQHFQTIRKKLNPKLNLLGMVLTRFDERKTMNQKVRQELTEQYKGSVFGTVIRTNMQLAKAQEAGKDIFSYDPQANGAKDYTRLATELLSKLY
ncbi:ParA family protein [Chitinophaga sp.]|uniref:ParA family protein n=1 Tax=Chitinophaga sp. TaxID=1869181 RepID=UPI0031D93A7B